VIVTVLGSGSAVPTARRSCAGYLVEWSRGALLLDAAAGTYMRALKAGLDPLRLRAVLLSHFHADHTADLPALLAARRLTEGLDRPLVVAGPPGTGELLRALRGAFGHGLDAEHEVRGFPCEVDGLRASAFPAAHTAEAVCQRVEADGRTLAYSGDTADCPGLREAVRGADLALLECTHPRPSAGHLSPAECEAVVAAARPRRVLLTHLGPDVHPSLPAAEDGLVVEV
jgi:ribonuclease BN (tRNA processing enzyme)